MVGLIGKMAGVTGLEPAASGVTGRRSNQLSYTPIGTAKNYGETTEEAFFYGPPFKLSSGWREKLASTAIRGPSRPL